MTKKCRFRSASVQIILPMKNRTYGWTSLCPRSPDFKLTDSRVWRRTQCSIENLAKTGRCHWSFRWNSHTRSRSIISLCHTSSILRKINEFSKLLFLNTYYSHIIHVIKQCNVDKLNWGKIDITWYISLAHTHPFYWYWKLEFSPK